MARPAKLVQIRRTLPRWASKTLPVVIASGFALGAVMTRHTQYLGHVQSGFDVPPCRHSPSLSRLAGQLQPLLIAHTALVRASKQYCPR
jgi:hypothetical protein